MEIRKLQFQGRSTYTVSLPKKWVEGFGLKKGDKLIFNETENSLVVSCLAGRESNEAKSINADTEILSRSILASYLAGFKRIRIFSSERISSGTKNEIKKSVARLNGLQIVEETSNEVLLQDLLDTGELDLRKAVKRAYSICASMQKDAITALKENDKELAKEVIQRDDEVDRLYFLAVRQLRGAISNPQYSLTGLECLDYRMVVKCIEETADACCEIAKKTIELDRGYDLEAFSDICYTIHEQAFAAYLSKNTKSAQALRKKESQVLEMKEKLLKPSISPVLDALVTIAKNGIDIADLVI